VRSGSTIATRAMMKGLTIPFLIWEPSGFTSVRMLLGVTSLPVPAVVGSRISGWPGRGTFRTHHIASRGVSFPKMTEVALATSMGLPPPRPIMISGQKGRANFALRTAVAIRGSGSTSASTSTVRPAVSREARACFTVPVFSARILSVTIKARLAPKAAASWPIHVADPSPVTILGGA
jgi:hypothetical protein